MIHLVLATHTEAKPIISYFKLKRLMHISEYQVFISKDQNLSLTISGIGKVFSACSVIFTYSFFRRQKNNIWINIGISGHNDLEIGEVILVNKINDLSSKKSWYPSIVFNHDFKVMSCNTYDQPNFKYTNNLALSVVFVDELNNSLISRYASFVLFSGVNNSPQYAMNSSLFELVSSL